MNKKIKKNQAADPKKAVEVAQRIILAPYNAGRYPVISDVIDALVPALFSHFGRKGQDAVLHEARKVMDDAPLFIARSRCVDDGLIFMGAQYRESEEQTPHSYLEFQRKVNLAALSMVTSKLRVNDHQFVDKIIRMTFDAYVLEKLLNLRADTDGILRATMDV